MNWLNKMERKFGRYAISNLMYYVIILYGLGYVIYIVNPAIYVGYLALNWRLVFQGQIWRLVTFLIQPIGDNLILTMLMLYIYYMIGKQLEAILGAFRFNFYFFSGVLMHILVTLVVYLVSGGSLMISPTIEYLNLSLFLVFASLFPDTQFLLFFAIPVSGKLLAVIDGLYFAWAIIRAFLPESAGGSGGVDVYSVSAIAALLNFALFYLLCRSGNSYSRQDARRKREYQKKVKYAQQSANTYEGGARHKCAVCGKTELDDPNLEFRYCSKCKGNLEYCQEHLFTHIHVE